MRAQVPTFFLALAFSVSAAPAQVAIGGAREPITYEVLRKLPVPVTASDIADAPYDVIGTVEAKVRKATVFSPDPSEQKVFKELWERGLKLKADAIINAKYGEAEITAFSWGMRHATGTAIRFKQPVEAGTSK